MEKKLQQLNLSSLDQLSLRCPIHQQYIIGFETTPSNNRHLKCFVCVQDQKLNAADLITLPNFQSEVSKLQGSLSGVSKLKVDAKLKEIDYSDNLNQIQQKVDKEKEILRNNFDDLIYTFTKQCNDKYEIACNLLDKEIKQLRENIKSYNNIIKDCSQSDDSPFQEFLAKLVTTTEVEPYEEIISQFVSYQEFSKVLLNDSHEVSEVISGALNQFQQLINSQLSLISEESKVKTQAKNQIQEIKSQIIPNFEKLGQFREEIIPLLISNCIGSLLKSSILSPRDSRTFLELAKGQFKTKFKANLVYSGSIHGFTASDFHSRCDPYTHTITVIESKDGDKFGGYSDKNWNYKKEAFVHSENTWLFSLVTNKVYPILQDYAQKAFWTGKTLLPTFGLVRNNDLRLESNCNVAQNYSLLGNSYESKGDKYLSTQQYFQVKEIEVYEIIFE